MLFKKGASLYAYEIVRESGNDVAYVNYMGSSYVPNIAENNESMSRAIDLLIENPNISRIVFVQQRNYSYDFNQVFFLSEIARIYTYLLKQERILSPDKLVFNCQQCLGKRHGEMNSFINSLKKDPIGAYIYIKGILREQRSLLEKIQTQCKACQMNYIRLLEKILVFLEGTNLIKEAIIYLEEYSLNNREIYKHFFRADVIPNFTFTRLIAKLPEEAKIIDEYEIGEDKDKTHITILKKKDESKYIYHVTPPEYILDEDHQMLLNLARNVLIEHQPKAEEFTDIERTRQTFFNVARDLLQELANAKGISLTYLETNKLAKILIRHTIGFGLIEVILLDEKLQDIILNAPISQNYVFVRHQKYDECITNIIPSQEDADGWAAKFRMLSGRPLDEANPILDTDLSLGDIRARVAVIQKPLSPYGLAYALRRHRDKPWTLPLFIKNKMLNSLSAGLLSFCVDGARTMLVAGTRSAGKTSLLGSLMLEIMSKYRIIVVEDTLELPADSIRKLGYDILRMKVRSALLQTSNEVSADEGIRTSLRLGDSCLIVGEVRSIEAKALYEAMRVGALANVVAGTIHGASPYGVFDRVVNDLQVPVTSFKATDIIVTANLVKSPSGMQSWRRVTQISEVRKHWTKDPLEEQGFVDLLKYNADKDELQASQELINGDSEIIKSIASNVKGWIGDWDAVYDNILLRAKIKEEIVNMAEKTSIPEILEAKFNSKCNSAFHEISENVRKDIGVPELEKVFPMMQNWMKKEIKNIVKKGNSYN
jgi:type IV secretory pathway ATPase VirB11/archaellum biosynthesis ATPase